MLLPLHHTDKTRKVLHGKQYLQRLFLGMLIDENKCYKMIIDSVLVQANVGLVGVFYAKVRAHLHESLKHDQVGLTLHAS